MDNEERRLAAAIMNTLVVRAPQQALATFGTTSIRYYLVSEPVSADLDARVDAEESVIREGVVKAERPEIVTPTFMRRAEGFGEHAQEYLDHVMRERGPHAPGLLYVYKNEGMHTDIVSGSPSQVAARISERLDRERRPLEAVVRGVGELWDVSLMKFIFDLTNASVRSNVSEMHGRGLLDMERGVPRDVRQRVERLLAAAKRGEAQPADVHRELERWGLFDDYQDEFLALFKK